MAGPRHHLAVVLVALAVSLTGAVLALAVGLPLAAAGRLGPAAFVAVVAAGAAGTFLATLAVLRRTMGRPLGRLLAAARRIGDLSGLPPLGAPGDEGVGGLSRAAVAFERTAVALAEERARLRAKIAELEESNAALAAARRELSRSERLASVGLLAAGVAHEIGNPLGAISGYAELARARLAAGAGEDAADFVDRIAADARRIDLIVRDLLDLAHPARIPLGPVAVVAALDDALGMARAQERFREVEVALELPDGLPPVLAEPRRLGQVLLNVLLNAGDAMAGRGRLRVSARCQGGDVELAFADEGPGIAAGEMESLFSPFYTTKPPGRGTGLGLAVCHAILESFGGAIRAENGPERGAVFVVRLRSA